MFGLLEQLQKCVIIYSVQTLELKEIWFELNHNFASAKCKDNH